MYYADLVTQKVTPDYYTDEDGKAIITDKVIDLFTNVIKGRDVVISIVLLRVMKCNGRRRGKGKSLEEGRGEKGRDRVA